MLDAKKLQENWELHKNWVTTYISSPRQEQILEFFQKAEDVIMFAPASGRAHFHNAFPGGYVDHVNRVVSLSLYLLGSRNLDADTLPPVDFTEEELVFAALFHDLGKIGDGKQECYVKQTDDWRRKKLGEIYTVNPELSFMLHADRSLFILQKLGIACSEKEYMGIKLHDGMFEDGNKPYFTAFNPESKLRTTLPYYLHTADFLAARHEYERWQSPEVPTSAPSPKKKAAPKGSGNLMSMVQNL